jgi:hypothetical protein
MRPGSARQAAGASSTLGRVSVSLRANTRLRNPVARVAGVALGGMFPRGSKLDAVENRWRRLADLPRERRCSFRCSTDSISTAAAAVYCLTLITALAVAAREHAADR